MLKLRLTYISSGFKTFFKFGLVIDLDMDVRLLDYWSINRLLDRSQLSSTKHLEEGVIRLKSY